MQITCSHCKKEFSADDKLLLKAGTSFQYYTCPACGKPVRWKVPAGAAPTAAAPAPVAPPAPAPAPTPAPAAPKMAEAPAAPGWLLVAGRLGALERYALAEGDNVVGRRATGSSATVLLDPVHDSVSRQHCSIEVVRDYVRGCFNFLTRDLNSVNGTCIGEGARKKRLDPNDIVYLENGDVLLLGETPARLDVNQAARFAPRAQSNAANATMIMPTVPQA